MNRLFVCFGADGIYGGLHGMNSYEIVESDSIDLAYEIARELSVDVIQSYHGIVDDLEAQIEEECDFYNIPFGEGTSEEEEIRQETYDEDLYYEVYELDITKLPTIKINELEEMLSYDPEGFIETYKIDKYEDEV